MLTCHAPGRHVRIDERACLFYEATLEAVAAPSDATFEATIDYVVADSSADLGTATLAVSRL